MMNVYFLQEQLQNSSDEGNKHSEERQHPTVAVHTPHVPCPGALAFKAKL